MAIDKEKILGIAQKYILKGQSKKAIQEYLRLIESSPKDKRLYLKLGDLYLKNGEDDKAIKEYLKLAELYAEEDLNFRAISIYKRVLSIDPKYLEAFHQIAKLYSKEGLAGSAKSYYQGILEIKPDDREALKALDDMESPQKSKEVPERALPPKAAPIEPRPSSQKERTQEDLPPVSSPNLPPLATDDADSNSPDKDSEMHYHLGIAYKEMELYDYAIAEFELASSKLSKKFDCCIMLGSCLIEKGDYDKAIAYYQMASEIPGLPDEKLARLRFHLGLAYEKKGMVSEAIDTFALALRLDHTLSEAQEKIKGLQGK